MKQKKNLWVNLLFAAVVLVIAGVLFYLRSAGQSGSTLGAELILSLIHISEPTRRS